MSPGGRWWAAAAVALACSALGFRHYFPPLPDPLAMDLVTEKWIPSSSHPLIVSGRTEAGDFLYVRCIDDHTLALGYESWGEPGRLSQPFAAQAGRPIRLEISAPALRQIRGGFAAPSKRLRLKANGTTIFDADVDFHLRDRDEFWFGENPIGGTACEPSLAGHLRLPDGRELRGSPAPLFGFSSRLAGWILRSRSQALAALLAGVAAFFIWPRIRWRELGSLAGALARGERTLAEHPWSRQFARHVWVHRWFLGPAVAATFAFGWMVTDGTFKFIHPEGFGSFYDFQAASILQGRLDIPDEAISGEAFIAHGKRYGYFGPTPALLRLPFVVFNVAFGELSRSFMLVEFAAALLASYLLLRAASRLVGGAGPSGWAAAVLIFSAGLGSTIFYLGSRAYIYHEAILCGVAFALFACWCALRHFESPAGRWWIGALICGVLSVQARAPAGLFALTLLGCVAAALVWRGWRTGTAFGRPLLVGALSVVGVLSFNAVSYLKFGTFDGCPLRLNVQYDAARLARIDGKNFHLANLPFAWATYVTQQNYRFEPRFPFFRVGTKSAKPKFPRAKIDYAENTLAMPAAMPSLFALATVGALGVFLVLPRSRPCLAITWASALPAGLAMFAAIAVTQRYTADFCPFLIVASAFALAGLDQAPPLSRTVLRTIVGLATIAAVFITFLITLQYQAEGVWGVPPEVTDKYHQLGRAIDALVASFHR